MANPVTPDGKDTFEPEPGKSTTARFCTDPRHETPCPLPCDACEEECGTEHEWSEEAKAQMLHDAAPEMLEALQRIVAEQDKVASMGRVAPSAEALSFARAAIAKATGKESI